MKVLRNGFQARRNCSPTPTSPLKTFCKSLVFQEKWCWVRQNMFPGPIHQMNDPLNLVVTKILFLFFCFSRLFHVSPRFLLLQPGQLHQVLAPSKKIQEKIARLQWKECTDGNVLYFWVSERLQGRTEQYKLFHWVFWISSAKILH